MSEKIYLVPEKYVDTEPLFERCGMTIGEIDEWLAAHEYKERTCKVTHEYSGEQFPHRIHVKELSCGHEFRYYEPSHVPGYCPECGAKVVSGDE